jgi:hypothetical protein
MASLHERCYCPGDCNCRHQGAPWHRFNYCGCKAHARVDQTASERIRAARKAAIDEAKTTLRELCKEAV